MSTVHVRRSRLSACAGGATADEAGEILARGSRAAGNGKVPIKARARRHGRRTYFWGSRHTKVRSHGCLSGPARGRGCVPVIDPLALGKHIRARRPRLGPRVRDREMMTSRPHSHSVARRQAEGTQHERSTHRSTERARLRCLMTCPRGPSRSWRSGHPHPGPIRPASPTAPPSPWASRARRLG